MASQSGAKPAVTNAAGAGGGAVTGGTTAGAGAAMAPTGASPQIIAIKVQFELDTPDGLRKVIFGLEKDTQGDKITWKINFQLSERANTSVDFTQSVSLDVEVDESLHANAETVATNGLAPPQAGHALGPAADDAKAASTGDISADDASQTVQDTLAQ
jgi:hypothetical protein